MIAYAIRAVTPTGRRYSQTEKEALSIVWGTENSHMYLYSKSFNLITDHKPLELIYGNPKSKPSLCIERCVLRLQEDSCKVIYKPGKDSPVDFMSRHPTTVIVNENIADEYVRCLTANAIPKAKLQRETDKGKTPQV